MRGRVLAVVAVGTVVAVLGTARGGAPPPDSVSWILVGGPDLALERRMRFSGSEGHHVTLGNAKRFDGMQLGVQLHAPGSSPQIVTPDLNPTTGASGQIAGPGPFTECPDRFHYHGMLYGASDSGLACGWGEAVPFDMANDALGFLSEATMLEIRAERKAGATPPDTAGAAQDLDQARAALQNLSQAVDALTGKLHPGDTITIAHKAIR